MLIMLINGWEINLAKVNVSTGTTLFINSDITSFYSSLDQEKTCWIMISRDNSQIMYSNSNSKHDLDPSASCRRRVYSRACE